MKSRSRTVLTLQSLESREVPAVTIVNATTATFTDIDGDKATVKVSTGTLTAGLFTTAAVGLGDQLQTVNFSAGGFDGAGLTISAVKVATGDGLVNVGYINSTGHDLGATVVKGDLGQIDAGDATFATTGLKSLSVRSLGRLGLDTQAGGANLKSDINGTLGALTVAGDIKDAFVVVAGGTDGKIGAITIGGSLIGGSASASGRIFSDGDIGIVKIGRDLQGGSASGTGSIGTTGKLAGVTIGGSVIGGSDTVAGSILSIGDLGAVKIGRDLIGGRGFGTGRISSNGKIASASIGGSLLGGQHDESGEIFCVGDLGPVKIGGNLTGGSNIGASSLNSAGLLMSFGRIASVTIGGSIISGIDGGAGTISRSAAVIAGNDIGSVVVKGSLIGNTSPNGTSPVTISARGQQFPSLGKDLAIGKVSIGGRVESSQILAGYENNALLPVNADAQIGSVTVGGDWIASSIVAGVQAGADNSFGTPDDARITGGTDNPGIDSKIGSVAIKGLVFGTPGASPDHFGFVAQQIGSFKALGVAAALTTGTDAPLLLALTTGDVRLREVM